MRHGSSQCSVKHALERMNTPSETTMKRTFSILAGSGLVPQIQQSFMKNIAAPSQPQ